MLKKNIGFIIGHLSHGGAEKQMYLLSKWIDKNKFNPIIICLSKESHPWGDRIKKLGLNIIYLPRLSSFDIIRVFRLVFCLYKYKIDLLVSYLHIANIYSWLARKIYFRKCSYVAQVRSRESEMGVFIRYLNIKAFNSAKLIITNSNLLIPFVEKYFQQPKEKIIFINNVIELENKLVRSIGDHINICIVAKDTYAKNIDLFIEFALKVISKFKNVHFNLVGRELEKKSRVFKLIPEDLKTFFTFHGEVDQINRIFEQNDIYISTSRSEGSPNVILEAMSYGLVVIATDVGGVRELVKHNKTGFLVNSGDAEALFRCFNKLLNGKNIYANMSRKSVGFIKDNFSINDTINRFETIFNKI